MTEGELYKEASADEADAVPEEIAEESGIQSEAAEAEGDAEAEVTCEEADGAPYDPDGKEERISTAPAATPVRHAAIPKRARRPEIGMSGAELASARELFEGLSDREIYELYRKVTK